MTEQSVSAGARVCLDRKRSPVTSTVPLFNADKKPYTRAVRLLEENKVVDVATMMLQTRRFRCPGRADRAQRLVGHGSVVLEARFVARRRG